MMNWFHDFQEALAEFRDGGGAILYAKNPADGRFAWQVGPADLIGKRAADSLPTDYIGRRDAIDRTAKKATEYALAQGGMTDREICDELADYFLDQ